ncbi:hypothetical protein GN956_G24990 [Arapaima gigas]
MQRRSGSSACRTSGPGHRRSNYWLDNCVAGTCLSCKDRYHIRQNYPGCYQLLWATGFRHPLPFACCNIQETIGGGMRDSVTLPTPRREPFALVLHRTTYPAGAADIWSHLRHDRCSSRLAAALSPRLLEHQYHKLLYNLDLLIRGRLLQHSKMLWNGTNN